MQAQSQLYTSKKKLDVLDIIAQIQKLDTAWFIIKQPDPN
jgi:hypothetical protein